MRASKVNICCKVYNLILLSDGKVNFERKDDTHIWLRKEIRKQIMRLTKPFYNTKKKS